MGVFLTYALNESGALVHVDDVANGAKCECHCPYCNAPLHAKKDGYISINLRGRSRYEDFEFPPELRIIDIVFKALSSTEDGARKRMKTEI